MNKIAKNFCYWLETKGLSGFDLFVLYIISLVPITFATRFSIINSSTCLLILLVLSFIVWLAFWGDDIINNEKEVQFQQFEKECKEMKRLLDVFHKERYCIRIMHDKTNKRCANCDVFYCKHRGEPFKRF